jgi:putative sigma-54 modulation protein
MRTNIKATGIELTPAITSYVEKKIGGIEKYFGGTDPVVQVEVGKSTQHHKNGPIFRAEVRVSGAGLNAYAASEQTDLYAAIDVVKDDIIQKLTHEKGKRDTMMRRGGRMMKNMMRGMNPFKKRG